MACVKPAPPPFKPPRFDQERAFSVCANSALLDHAITAVKGKSKAEEWIQQVLRETGAEVTVHAFQHTPEGAMEPAEFSKYCCPYQS